MEEIYIEYIDMPSRVHGLTCLDAENNYRIFINSRLSSYMQREAYEHEMSHIRKNHFAVGTLSFAEIEDSV